MLMLQVIMSYYFYWFSMIKSPFVLVKSLVLLDSVGEVTICLG